MQRLAVGSTGALRPRDTCSRASKPLSSFLGAGPPRGLLCAISPKAWRSWREQAWALCSRTVSESLRPPQTDCLPPERSP